jgi:putrescine importer
VRERAAGRRPSPLVHVVAPVIGAGVCVWLLAHLDGRALTLGLIWLGLGVVYPAYLTRLFRVPPPEMAFTEESADAPKTEPVG